MSKICILGGTGFVGRHLAGELTRRGYAIRVLTRRRERHRHLLVYPTLELVDADIHSVSNLSAYLEGCDAAVNLVGILNEGPGGDFSRVHAELPAKIAEACGFNRIKRYLHMSALNASPDAPSGYLRSKAEGEKAAFEASREGLEVTSFRPSVIFGHDDSFFNQFALLLRFSPPLFPLGCPDARFAPVWVQDVVRAFATALEDRTTIGNSYELCGPKQYTLKELVQYTAANAGLRRRVIGLSDGLSKLQARLAELAPGKPFSVDNYLSLQVDSVCSEDGLAALGITPATLESVVPYYLQQRDRAATYASLRRASGGP